MKLVTWIFSFAYELLVDLLLSIVGHHRGKESFERKQKVYKPLRAFLEKYLNIKMKIKKHEDQISKNKRSLSYKVITLFLLILGVLWIRYSIIEPYKIPSGSMIPTLKIGDHIFVNKLAYGLRIPFLGEVARWSEPKRGDVVVFRPPHTNKVFVKRLIGLPGDRIRVEDTKLYVNDELISKSRTDFYPVMEDVADTQQYTQDLYNLYVEDLKGVQHYELELKDRGMLFHEPFSVEVVVPQGYLYFMGDNRDNSEDSRMWGFARREEVRGRAMFVWLSLNWSKTFTPSWIRFSRFGKKIK